MPEGLAYLLVFIALVVLYTVGKVIAYVKKSEQQWQEVDKSKLRVWEDDDD